MSTFGDSPASSQGGGGGGRRPPGMAPQQQQQQQQQPQQQRESSAGPSSAGGEPSSERSSFSMGLGFLRGLGTERKTKEGQPQKRRGPKPDSKPALTRRQELNRQAQRTHRERKEFYIKSLESEVMHLKEVYTGTVQEKNAVEQENQRLKELLRLHGIAFDGSEAAPSQTGGQMATFPQQSGNSPPPPQSSTASHGMLSSSAFSPGGAQYMSSSTTPEMFGGPGDFNDPSAFQAQPTGAQQPQPPVRGGGNLDYDQLGVDFVLASVSPEQNPNPGAGQPFGGYNLRGGAGAGGGARR